MYSMELFNTAQNAVCLPSVMPVKWWTSQIPGVIFMFTICDLIFVVWDLEEMNP